MFSMLKETTGPQDFRALFKQIMGPGYFIDKAKDLRITSRTLSNVLSGKHANPKILDECLAELEKTLRERIAAIKRINELMAIHEQLQRR